MIKTTDSIQAKLRDFDAAHMGVDGATGAVLGNDYRGTSAVRDVAAERAEADRKVRLAEAVARIRA